jgi:hypothetical protein
MLLNAVARRQDGRRGDKKAAKGMPALPVMAAPGGKPVRKANLEAGRYVPPPLLSTMACLSRACELLARGVAAGACAAASRRVLS